MKNPDEEAEPKNQPSAVPTALDAKEPMFYACDEHDFWAFRPKDVLYFIKTTKKEFASSPATFSIRVYLVGGQTLELPFNYLSSLIENLKICQPMLKIGRN